MRKLILLSLLFFSSASCFAQSGQLDATFGNHGIVKTDLGSPFNYSNFGKQILLQPDGSIYLVFEGAGSTLIAKKHPDGSADITYGNNGFSVAASVYAIHAVIQTDGKIVIAGYTKNPEYYYNPNDFALARFNTDGSLDSTFDGDGIQVTDLGYLDIIHSLSIQGDGKIVVAGSSADAEYFAWSSIALARYNIDGSLDGSFGSNGIVRSDFGTHQDANSIAIQRDGKIVIAAFIDISFALVRYNSDGTPDLTFNGTGYRYIDTQGGFSSIVLQSDNKIIAGSSIDNGSNTDFEVARFNPDGTWDNTFDGDGVQRTDFTGTGDVLTSIALQSDGKIIAAGYTSESGNNNFAIARYNADGSLDITFNGDGKQTTGFGSSDDYANSVAIGSDAKIVVLGYTINGVNTYVAASRYNNDGGPDNSFNGNGMLVDHVNQGDTHYTSAAIQANGKIVVAGYTWNGTNYDFAIVRYNNDGTLDNTFSGDGKQTSDFNGFNDYANSIAIQSDGKIVVAGASGDNFGVARYNSDGSPDNTFDEDGKLTTDFGTLDFANFLVIQSDGKIIVGGSALARYNTDGSPDVSFNGNGKLTLSFTGNAIALQTDRKIIVSGSNRGDAIIARYNTDGSTDGTFGTDGVKSIFSYPDAFWTAKSVAMQNDGRIVVGGSTLYTYRTRKSRFALIRLNQDGNPDETFGSAGVVYVSPGPSLLDYGMSVLLQSDNKIILAGSSYSGSNDDFAIVRFNTDGSLDNTFSGDGIEITKASTAYDGIAAIALANGNLYAAGYGQYPGNFGVIARYLLAEGGPVPVSLLDFTGVLQDKSVLLKWKIATAKNLASFGIERSADGNRFMEINSVKTTGVSAFTRDYSIMDQQPLQGINFYRLKMVDADGKFTYSNIVAVKITAENKLQIFPNPAERILFVEANGSNENAIVRIVDGGGRKLKEVKVFLNGKTSFSIDISSLPNGIYNLVLNKKEKTEVQRFIKK